jgi:hypothetical protein
VSYLYEDVKKKTERVQVNQAEREKPGIASMT